ncbi:uncharacterized protein [Chelonus insularis]|uniref:uncharacterized protein n=1 Tax=Chelonus insularis TaxID=460826 RepID=UPI001589F0B3|nr:uncharacterized protein LOC118068245 [Chelonus insularis]XP_034941397.1 uncharacterized protein LOC118068245 [Chelonus insularis]
MPGIHVRASGKLDWVEREKEPILTVPGSYWLCHKKNIYKFTFKYHRSSKDTKEFSYGKELMKVIRRIIKSQPRQGQQFGTRHLLVTYNHSSWTRQDKMFAMLKFRDRTNATAFPRAFVLIVKILPTNPTFENGKEFEDELIVYEKSTRRSQWNNSSIDKQDDISNSDETLQKSRLPSTISSNGLSSDLPKTSSDNVKSNGTRVNTPVTRSMRSSERQKRVSSASFLAGLDDLPLIEKYLSEQQDQSNLDNSTATNQECLNELQETVDMPYQYLIEREIERSKSRLTRSSNAQKMAVDESIEKAPKEKRIGESATPRSRTPRLQSSSNIIDNATARSSNITDLVMEGLMFTIRQDQDSVTVVEQKTKLEPDEVLENSEKIETKEGAECLVNSSLLKLENLVTKIEMSSNAKTNKYEDDQCTQLNSLSAIDLNNKDNEEEAGEQEDVEDVEVDDIQEVEVDSKEQDKNTQKLSEKNFDDEIEEYTALNLETIDDHQSQEEKSLILTSHQQSFKNSLEKKIDDVPLVTINLSNVHDILNSDFKDECSSTFSEIHSLHEESEVNEDFEDSEEDFELQDHPDVSIEEDNAKLHDNKEDNEEESHVDIEEDEEDEDIIPEALCKNNQDCIDDNVGYEISTDSEENNLLMDDIEIEQSSNVPEQTPPQNKSSRPRIISSEVVQYDLSSIRSLNLRRKIESESSNQNTSNTNDFEKSPCNSGTQVNKESITSTEKSNKIAEKINEPTVLTRRRLTAKRRLCSQKQEDDNGEVKIEMDKFVKHMTQGVRVVLERLDLEKTFGRLKRNGCFKV